VRELKIGLSTANR